MMESVVIDNLNLVRAVGLPLEAEAPLLVDADGVLAFAVSLEGFEPVSGWDVEVVEFGDGVELGELAQRHAQECGREFAGLPVLEESGGFPAGEGVDHGVG